MDIPLPDAKKLVYFGPPWITWSNLEYTQPPTWLSVFIQRDSPGGVVGGGIPIRRSSVEIISSFFLFFYRFVGDKLSLDRLGRFSPNFHQMVGLC